jgi:hypothetical protein
MYNVIYDDDGKSGNQFYNARLLVEKYHITPEYIVKQAVECSQLGKGPDYDPYADGQVIFSFLLNYPAASFVFKIRYLFFFSGLILGFNRTNLPTDENARCLMNLPVCDTRQAGKSSSQTIHDSDAAEHLSF